MPPLVIGKPYSMKGREQQKEVKKHLLSHFMMLLQRPRGRTRYSDFCGWEQDFITKIEVRSD